MSPQPSDSQTLDEQAVRDAAHTGLAYAPLLLVFYEACSIETQRQFFEQVLRLPVIENRFYPPHEVHGIVKYDGGTIIPALNLSGQARFQLDGSDGLTAVFSDNNPQAVLDRFNQYESGDATRDHILTDHHHHHFQVRQPTSSIGMRHTTPRVEQLRLLVDNLNESIHFYADILGLRLLSREPGRARFAAGLLELVLDERPRESAAQSIRHDTYLLVFHTPQIEAAYAGLKLRGLSFRSPRVGYSDIGGTARFRDPSGHTFCLYEASDESLSWESGNKVKEIIAASDEICAAQRLGAADAALGKI